MLDYFLTGLEALGYDAVDERMIGYECLQLYAEEIDDTIFPLTLLTSLSSPLTTWSFTYVPEGTALTIELFLIDRSEYALAPLMRWYVNGKVILCPTRDSSLR